MIATRHNKLGRGTGFGVGDDGDPVYTVTAAHGHAVCAGFKFHAGSSAGSMAYQHEQSPTITADWHSPAVLCMTDTQPNTMVAEDLCGTLSCHSKKDPPVVCMADDNAKAAIDEDLCGTLKVGGAHRSYPAPTDHD